MKKKILIIEEDAGFRRQLFWALHEYYEVFEAQDRREAFHYLSREAKPDLIIMGLYFPPKLTTVEEGFIILKEFKITYPEIRVIVVSSNQEKTTIAQTKNLGAEEYFVKPPHLDTLKKVVKEALNIPNQRGYLRVRKKVSVVYEFQENSWMKDTSYSENMSLGGIMMTTNYHMSPLNYVRLGLSLQEDVQSLIELTGQVRWEKRVKMTNQYQVGIQFTQMKDEVRQKLAHYMYE